MNVANVVCYGADPSGRAPSDGAFISAMNVAFKNSDVTQNKQVYIPAGKYLLTKPGLFNAWSSPQSFRKNVSFTGDGCGASRIIFRPSAPDAYLYDGVAFPNNRLMFMDMSNLCIECDSSLSNSSVNLFKQFGNNDGYPDQAYVFRNCRFDADINNPGILLNITGPFNGDSNKFLFCAGAQWKHIMLVDNPQAVVHYVIGCEFHQIRGDAFKFERGSSLNVFGGSYIIGQTGITDNGSLLNLPATVSGISGTFNFFGVRTEIFDPSTKIFKLSGRDNIATVNVIGMAHRSQPNGDPVLVSMDAYSGARIIFDGCELIPETGDISVEFANGAGAQNWWHSFSRAGKVELNNCAIQDNLFDLIKYGALAEGGVFRARGCTTRTEVDVATPAFATDFDTIGPLGWISGRNANAIGVKSISGVVTQWPNSANPANAAVKLPVGSIIKAIRVRKVASGSAADPYQLKITNDDDTHTYGASSLAQQKDQHDAFLEGVNRYIEATGVDQVIRVRTTRGNGGGVTPQAMSAGDMFIVEYY